MDRRPLLALALALSLLLAGCGGTASTPTREPFSVPDTTTITDPAGEIGSERPPPSFSPNPRRDTIGDPAVFLDSQARRLAGTSYRVDYEFAVRYANGTTRNRISVDGSFARDRRVFFTNATFRNPVGRTVRLMYGNGSALFVAEARPSVPVSNATVRVPRSSDGSPVDPLDAGAYRALRPEFVYTGFTAMNVTDVIELDRTPSAIEEQLFRVRATVVERPESLLDAVPSAGDGARVENATLEAIVAHDGFVYEYAIEYTVVRADGARLHVSRRLVYRGLGTTAVIPPDWARDNATTVA